ncbi:tyrosine-type recombinase/integrase [Listeria monocytogenes]|uniref:site-specific integrase n=1 Tax=Listeria TaxID=1637 RepID=UPI001906EF9E|nr:MULTISPECIES: tyrosine-type recombinase/integrase [Listeria]MBK1965124.1 tyrosine-type recombinase/integrase [Listeria ivanovii subsp. londoniensis]WDE53463.1 tyrosine-type recombinase/integrase [Listeria monocytogenes]HEM1440060.1 tyrosine-type recombinase/integrase [Listeria monocytogenes]
MAKKKEILFCDYYDEWIETYKVNAITEVTLKKYYQVAKVLREICPRLFISDFDRREYQRIINEYAKTHEKQTTIDFHHHVKSCIKDMFHDRLIDIDPTYKAVLKGIPKADRKKKFLQKEELTKLLQSLDLGSGINKDWFILLVAKTGMRFSECLAITPHDFDWNKNTLSINKTWDYKISNDFSKTKTESSIRNIKLDWQIVGQFKPLLTNLPATEPIFIEKNNDGTYKREFNSTINSLLSRKCKQLGITEISLHALRHTHASVLLAEGVSIHTISSRLGHADVGVTQTTYAHVLDELQKKDDQKMMSVLMQIA